RISGNVMLYEGTITARAATPFAATVLLQGAAGAVYDFSALTNVTASRLIGGMNVILPSETLRLNGAADVTDTVSGVLSGTGGLQKQHSTSVLILTGASEYTGNTTIAGGLLRLAGQQGSITTSPLITVVGSSTLQTLHLDNRDGNHL